MGLRQAFDRPVVLIQEEDTPEIFDIALLRYTSYRKALVYHEVINDQANISAALTATVAAHEGDAASLNSIVQLLSLVSPAALKSMHGKESEAMVQVVMAEVSRLRRDVRKMARALDRDNHKARLNQDDSTLASERSRNTLEREETDSYLRLLRSEISRADIMTAKAISSDDNNSIVRVCRKVLGSLEGIRKLSTSKHLEIYEDTRRRAIELLTIAEENLANPGELNEAMASERVD